MTRRGLTGQQIRQLTSSVSGQPHNYTSSGIGGISSVALEADIFSHIKGDVIWCVHDQEGEEAIRAFQPVEVEEGEWPHPKIPEMCIPYCGIPTRPWSNRLGIALQGSDTDLEMIPVQVTGYGYVLTERQTRADQLLGVADKYARPYGKMCHKVQEFGGKFRGCGAPFEVIKGMLFRSTVSEDLPDSYAYVRITNSRLDTISVTADNVLPQSGTYTFNVQVVLIPEEYQPAWFRGRLTIEAEDLE